VPRGSAREQRILAAQLLSDIRRVNKPVAVVVQKGHVHPVTAVAQHAQRRFEVPDEPGVPHDEENLQAIRIVTKQDRRSEAPSALGRTTRASWTLPQRQQL
jgi:hypothetical protein